MNPSPAAIAAIQTYAAALQGGWAGNTDAQVLAAANAPSVTNPIAQPTVAKAYTFVDLMGKLSESSITNLKSLPYLPTIIDTINSGDLVACERWIALLSATSTPSITPTEAGLLAAVMTATEADPSWSAQIPWSVATLGRALDLFDVAISRPSS